MEVLAPVASVAIPAECHGKPKRKKQNQSGVLHQPTNGANRPNRPQVKRLPFGPVVANYCLGYCTLQKQSQWPRHGVDATKRNAPQGRGALGYREVLAPVASVAIPVECHGKPECKKQNRSGVLHHPTNGAYRPVRTQVKRLQFEPVVANYCLGYFTLQKQSQWPRHGVAATKRNAPQGRGALGYMDEMYLAI